MSRSNGVAAVGWGGVGWGGVGGPDSYAAARAAQSKWRQNILSEKI